MDYGQAVKVLRGVPLFAKLDPAKLKLVAFASEFLTVNDGEALFRTGNVADSVYLIDRGEAVVTTTHDDREVTITTLARHQLFGEMAIFLDSPRTAKGELGVLSIDAKMFLSLISESPETALGVMRILSDKIVKAMENYEELDSKLQGLRASPPAR
ncbi:MAG: cyclic nucleotide-binding domain-containing protein [Rhodospirillales bacterium]|nr:cyclic nucleotide-binding domain-containing protein [Rhodospirillales bacterium]